MKKEELLEIGLTEEQADKVFAMNGRDTNKTKSDLEAKVTELESANKTIQELQATVKKFDGVDVDGLKTSLDDLQKKYEDDTAELKHQMEERDYSHAISAATSGMKFTSESARRAFVSDLAAKKLPLQDGKMLGLDDFVKEYRGSDPDAFVPENDDKMPVAVRGAARGVPQGKDPAQMTYTELCAFMANNPNAEI